MRTQKDINPSERFLQAVMQFSDKTIQLWKSETIRRCKDKDGLYDKFINWKRQENEVAVFTMYAYADLFVPKTFDCIFFVDNPEVYNQTNFVLTQSIWEGWYPIDNIENEHKHLCILTFENQVPDILAQLHYETEKYSTWTVEGNKILGLCQMADLQSIIDRNHKQVRLKQLHGDNWYYFDDPT